MKLHTSMKAAIFVTSIVCPSFVAAQNQVVVIPMFDTKVVFTGIGTTGDMKCSEYKISPGNWQEIDCGNLPTDLQGQDAELRSGVQMVPRYKINGDGTVKDELTGLVWLRNAFCTGEVLGNTWEEALGFIVEMNASGKMNGNGCGDTSDNGSYKTNWRLPNVKELQSLLYFEHDMDAATFPFISNANGNGPYTNGDPFQNIQINEAYWSSTNYGFVWDPDLNVNLIDDVLRVNFSDAVTDGTDKNGKQHVWAVRAEN